MITPEHAKALSHHAPTPEAIAVHERLRIAAKEYVAALDELLPASREASLAFTSAQESLMWAYAAVAIHISAKEQ